MASEGRASPSCNGDSQMIWGIASLPFWIVGAILFLVAILGLIKALQTDKTPKDFFETFVGFGIIMLGAGLLFTFAAKIAS